jgi:methionyl aminopeptidase
MRSLAMSAAIDRLGGVAKRRRASYMAGMNEHRTLGRNDSVIGYSGNIRLYGPEGFAGMRAAGRLAAEILDTLAPLVLPGITTQEIDDIVHRMMLDAGAVPATLGYRGYTKSCCTSINHVVCHGIPGTKALKDGDIVNIDVTPILDGWHGDTSRMYLVGNVPIKAKRLVDVTYEALMRGIEAARPGNYLGDIGHAIQSFAESHRYGVVRDFCGHGLGQNFHEPPEVVHVGRPGTGPELKPGMIFTIEPMINIGKPATKVLEDGWTAVTRDRSLSAQFEHSIGITENGCEIFTKSPKGLDKPPYA